MKILYIAHSRLLYGANIALLHLLEGLKNYSDVEPLVVLPCEGDMQNSLMEMHIPTVIAEVPQYVYPPHATFRDVIAYPLRLTRILISQRKSIKKIAKIAKDFKPDIIHSNVGVIHSGYAVSKRMHIPHVWHIREFQDLFFGWTPIPSGKSFKNKLNDKINHIVVISDVIRKHYGLSDHADVVYDGVFNENEIRPIIKTKSNYFLYVGQLHKSKGIFDVIEAYRRFSLINTDYRLMIAGEGIAMKEIKEMTKGINGIELLGYRNDVYELMRNAKALIVASTFEGFGFITVEAMFNGCVVIGRDSAATKEQFDNAANDTGKELGIRFTDTDSLVNSMLTITKMSQHEYLAICTAAQNYVTKKYSIKKHSISILNKYKEIVKENVKG